MDCSGVVQGDLSPVDADADGQLLITLAEARCLRSALREAVTHLWIEHPVAHAQAIQTYRSLPRDMTRLDDVWSDQSGMRPAPDHHEGENCVLEVLPESRRLYRAALASSVSYFSTSGDVQPRLCATPVEARSLLALLDGAPRSASELPASPPRPSALRRSCTVATSTVQEPGRRTASLADPQTWVTEIWGVAQTTAEHA